MLLGNLEVYAVLDMVSTDQTEFVLFNTKSYICENLLFYICRCIDPVLEGAKHPNPVSKGGWHHGATPSQYEIMEKHDEN